MTPKSVSEYQMADGHTLYRWTDRDGSKWACCGYDHSPMCRRCQPVDETLDDLLENVMDGTMLCKQDPKTAEFLFKMTDAGEAQAKHLIATSDDPVIAEIRRRYPEIEGGSK
jgi:hypothetical protein